MARKSAQPALYELIRRGGEGQRASAPLRLARVQDSPRAEPSTPPVVDEEPASEAPVLGDMLTPGKSIRIPVGYLFVGAAAIVALAVLAYVVGHSSGEQQARTALDQQAVDQFNAENAAHLLSDPLVDPPSPGGGARSTGMPGAGAFVGSGSESAGRGARMGAIEADPREVGTNYYYLVYTTRSKAVELAEFCRENGLEAYVVRGDNPELRRVMVLPGFASGQSSSPVIRQLRERIEETITRWKLKTPNRDTLTYYPEKYKG